MVPTNSPGAVSYSASVDPNVVSVTVFEIGLFDIKIKAIFAWDVSLKVS